MSVTPGCRQGSLHVGGSAGASHFSWKYGALYGTLLRITEARYSVGQAAQQDVFKTQTQLSILEIKLVDLQREHNAREAEIASLLNRPPGAPLGRPPDPQPQEFATPLEDRARKEMGSGWTSSNLQPSGS